MRSIESELNTGPFMPSTLKHANTPQFWPGQSSGEKSWLQMRHTIRSLTRERMASTMWQKEERWSVTAKDCTVIWSSVWIGTICLKFPQSQPKEQQSYWLFMFRKPGRMQTRCERTTTFRFSLVFIHSAITFASQYGQISTIEGVMTQLASPPSTLT